MHGQANTLQYDDIERPLARWAVSFAALRE
jgi:hypothetical protein